jgi:hypothetical protein
MDPVNQVDLVKSPRQWMLVIVLDLAVLIELCVAMYLAASSPEDLTAVFIKSFFSMLIPTLVIGFFAKRWLRPEAIKA